MKKIMIVMMILCSLILITGCENNTDIKINYKEDQEHNNMDNYTYKFIGESEHFYFETGKVYYNNKNRAILISNFKVKNNVDKNAKLAINLYFNNNLLYGDIPNEDNLLTKQEFENTVIAENGTVGEKDKNGYIIGESDSFLETTSDTFKKSIKLEGSYCVKDKCMSEQFKITYLN